MKDITKPDIKKLTIKQRKWIKEYISTGNATEAAQRVYNCKDRISANAIGSENLAKLSFPDLMEEMGLTDVALLNVGAAGLLSEKTTITGDKVPDKPTIHRYWETLLKLKGKLKDSGNVTLDAKILVIPSELIAKYEITSDTSDSSK
jgi:hypothetical protein